MQAKINGNAERIYDESYEKLCVDNDKVFSVLLALQWVAAIVFALVVSPRTWIGERNLVHIHVIASVVIGGLLTIVPIYLNRKNPGATVNRYVNVIAQGLYSALFIHLTGGRIETHFHVFGSLAFFAFYRDIRVLFVGTLIVAVDHAIRGIFLPESVFGILTESNWRWLEHAAWVLFEDFFLGWSILRSIEEMKTVSFARAEVMSQHENAEELVKLRTRELQKEHNELQKRNETIGTIYRNVRSGFLLINHDLRIENGFTDSCSRLIGTSIKEGVKLFDVLGLRGRDSEHFQAMVEGVFEDMLPEEVSLGQIPPKHEIDNRVIKIEGGIVRNSDCKVKNILFTITDVTDLKRTEEQNTNNLSLIKILQQRDAFSQFVIDAKGNLEECKLLFGKKEQPLLRFLLHSLKGNASVFGLEAIVALIHGIEDDPEINLNSILTIETSLKNFLRIHWEILNIKYEDSFAEMYTVDKEQLGELASLSPHGADVLNWIENVKLKPAKDFLDPLVKMGTNISTRLSKDAIIILETPDFLVDGVLLRPIFQNMTHLIRNAVDHGIELPNQRGTKGSKGHVKISVGKKSSHWCIETIDDGRGIDLGAVCKVALNKNLITKEQAEKMSDQEKMDLIYLGGVSTIESITQFSGRGIGMSAMADAVKRVSGKITVSSSKGLGTHFTIMIPMRTTPLKLKSQLAEAG